ncbi:MAG: 2-amino-4-hydroxy-6-hydroxymethyldihydropteridine diphosphokinase, partial [Pseudomonadota bacterium]
AFEALDALPGTRLIAQSGLYRSAPFGGVEQADFINAAAALLTKLDAPDLLLELKAIERARGREPGGVRWGPRVLDLDLLVYASVEIDEPDLKLPHPGIAERNFVLLPLSELAPDLHVPGLGRLAGIPVNRNEPRIERIV